MITRQVSIQIFLLEVLILLLPLQAAISQIEKNILVVRPHQINDVLNNPGMGFMITPSMFRASRQRALMNFSLLLLTG
jgi:hypothetical protein